MKHTVLALALGSLLLVGCQQGNSVEDLNPRQRDAVAEAERFVEYSNMSYLGLIDMLEFLNFTHEEAVFATDFVEANWFEECADEAKDLIEYSSKTEVGGNGYWANKQSYQFGVKSFDCFNVKNLFLQGEFNMVRPYMYSHYDGEDNYAHLNQPLAHPWGANFYEIVARAQYNYKRFYFQYKMNFGQWGDDITTKDGEFQYYGHDIYQNYYVNEAMEKAALSIFGASMSAP